MPARGVQWADVFLVVVLWAALSLRLGPWPHNRFLEDEALYASWGLEIATGDNPLLDGEPVDKPPLLPYTLALVFVASGSSGLPETVDKMHRAEAMARLPSLMSSMAAIALTFALAKDLATYRNSSTSGKGAFGLAARSSLLAAVLLAVAPFDVLFASTAFTDPLMTALALAALVSALRRRSFWAGLLVGLAAAAKQQGLLFLPLVLTLTYVALPRSAAPDSAQPTAGRLLRVWHLPWLRLLLGLAIVVAGVAGWDLARTQQPGFLHQSLISYGGLAAAPATALPDRAAGWLRLLGFFWGSGWLTLALVLVVVGWFSLALRSRRLVGNRALPPAVKPGAADAALLAFVAAYLLFHWLLQIQLWDRYLLCLVPLVAVLVARSLTFLWGTQASRQPQTRTGDRPSIRGAVAVIAALTAAAFLAPGLARAVRSEFPVGGDHGAYDGIESVAAHVWQSVPADAVLYDDWLGYHYRFYLYGSPMRRHWFPDLSDLVHDATVYRRKARFITFASWREPGPILSALAEAGISVTKVMQARRRDGTVSFRLYQLEGPPP